MILKGIKEKSNHLIKLFASSLTPANYPVILIRTDLLKEISNVVVTSTFTEMDLLKPEHYASVFLLFGFFLFDIFK